MSGHLWTALELAKAAGVTRRWVLILLASGKIKGQQLSNGAWVITEAEAQRWLKDRSEP